MLNPTLGQVSPAHVMSRHLAATVGAILAIVLCGWLLYTYMPKELYLHFWRAVYPARRVLGVFNCCISSDDGLGDSSLRVGFAYSLTKQQNGLPLPPQIGGVHRPCNCPSPP